MVLTRWFDFFRRDLEEKETPLTQYTPGRTAILRSIVLFILIALACLPVTGQQQVATPTFSPRPGTYAGPQSVTISDTTSGAIIYYTTNGGTPTTSSTIYTGPVMFSSSGVLKAIATASGMSQSSVARGGYNIGLNILTQRYDNARSGTNYYETILTPGNVNTTEFGKLFSYSVDGYVYAQPLYMWGVSIPGKGIHNILFVATENDSVYAFDADSNAGANASPLWQITLLDSAHGAATGATAVPSGDLNLRAIVPVVGITGTPVIDRRTGSLYVVGMTKESGTYVHRLHALDITTGAEKSNSPVVIAASVPGAGAGSNGGGVRFDPKVENQRPGLLLMNGIVYIGYSDFGSIETTVPSHGWILAYGAGTLQQTGAFCTTPNGAEGGIWMSGSGLAGAVDDPANHPYGRMFVATGNGKFDASSPYTNSMDYGDSILDLDLSGGNPTVQDLFTPFNQATLSAHDVDLGSGGVLLLPGSNKNLFPHLLVQTGKEGRIYLINRDNMGGYDSSTDNIVQEIPSASQTSGYEITGIWGIPTYWCSHIYFWGSNGDELKSFPLNAGWFWNTWTSKSTESSSNYGPVPIVSSNACSNGIVWTIDSRAYAIQGHAILRAYDTSNVATLLYSSDQNPTRDDPGAAVKFTVPVVVNGKVYVGAEYQVSVFGLLNNP